jgi:hypothetical protein
VQNFDLEIWNAVAAPKAMPRAHVDKLAAAVSAIVRTPDMRAKLAVQGWQVVQQPGRPVQPHPAGCEGPGHHHPRARHSRAVSAARPQSLAARPKKEAWASFFTPCVPQRMPAA